LSGHEDRHDRKRHRHAEVANKENSRQQQKAPLRRVIYRLESHRVLLAVLNRRGAKKRTPIDEDR
jgi:hypothetical protein